MSADTSIEWCDATFNPWWGCTRISPGCDHCYAEHHARRFGVRWGADAPRRIASESTWAAPDRWNVTPFFECACGYRGTMKQLTTKAVHGCGLRFVRARRRVFCASMADVFDVDAPEGARERLWALFRATPNLDHLLLTKRIGNAARMLPADWGDGYPNVWLGATIVNQAEADRDIPKLLRTPARVRFLSCEPLLGPVDISWALSHPLDIAAGFLERGHFSPGLEALRRLDWIIAGGESGRSARPMHPAWPGALRDQCVAARVPFLFKQWGSWVTEDQSPLDIVLPGTSRLPWAELNDRTNEWSRGDQTAVYQVPKQAAGRLLDGVLHNAFPSFAEAA